MTSYDHNVKNEVNLCPLLHFRSPEKSNTAATLTQLVDQKLNVGAYSNLGGLQQVFFLKHMVGASKKVRCCIWVPCRSTPNFAPKPQNLGNYDKSSNNMK